jgi:hypothetical protein
MTHATRSTRPAADEYAGYYEKYISAVPDGDILATLAAQRANTLALLNSIPESKGGSSYAPGKWSIKEVIGHVIDCERVFAYRALRIARNDTTPLASIDQDALVREGKFNDRTLRDLALEFDAVRSATLALLANLADETWSRRGTASNNPVTTRSLAWITAGHEKHHGAIVREKYL